MQERIKDKLKEIEREYTELQEGIEEYQNNVISSSQLKPKGSKFGIYEQKGNTMMLRLKTVGGELSTKKLKELHSIMKEYEVPYIHLSTRENYQLQEVKFENVKNIIEKCNECEMYFRGGGGNTFRSILTNSDTGVAKGEVFDVMPYARMVENEVFFNDKAFDFGRKLKMGIASENGGEYVMPIQDLGFIAKEINGQKGFKLYCGGGLGRNPKLGHVLMDFLPEKELLRAVVAIINIFYDHGNRENRAKARLRFFVEEIGFKAFSNIFYEYFNKSKMTNKKLISTDYETKIHMLKKFENRTSDASFESWKKVSVSETKFKDVVSLELFVKNGNLTLKDLENLLKMLKDIGATLIRATINQNLFIPLVHRSALGYIYDYLIKYLPHIVSDMLTMEGQIRACVGNSVCMIGLEDSMEVADAVGKELNALALEYPSYREIIFKEASNIRISGCGSACAGIATAPLGFIGIKKRVDEEIKDCMQVYIGGILQEDIQALSIPLKEEQILLEEVPAYVKKIFKGYLKTLKTDNISFTRYMYNKRLSE